MTLMPKALLRKGDSRGLKKKEKGIVHLIQKKKENLQKKKENWKKKTERIGIILIILKIGMILIPKSGVILILKIGAKKNQKIGILKIIVLTIIA